MLDLIQSYNENLGTWINTGAGGGGGYKGEGAIAVKSEIMDNRG